MLKDMPVRSKEFLNLTRPLTQATLLWLAGLFIFSGLVGFMATSLPDWLRRYSLQIFLLVSMLHLLFVMKWRPLMRISKKSLVLSVGAIAAYWFILKGLDLVLGATRGPALISHRSFEDLENLILLAGLAPLFEELFFRDLLLRALSSKWESFWMPLLLSSFFFMTAHMSLYPGAFLLGLVSGTLVYFSGSVLPSILFHSLSNLSWFFLPTLFPNLFQMLLDLRWINFFYR